MGQKPIMPITKLVKEPYESEQPNLSKLAAKFLNRKLVFYYFPYRISNYLPVHFMETAYGVGDAITGKVTSVINGVEETIESTFDKITGSVGAAEEKVKSEMKALEGGVKSMFDGSNEDKMTDSIKPEDIDELLSALPEGEEEAMEAAKAAAEEAVEKAVEEVAEEEANN
ncbi:hypothetical protein RUM43_013506 [Polyplax serrata]|uniref:Uncharacterized protein n=1 Tax=Polyplax serrata TaxID=468196 RepID=A0AAN8NY16_POLSC